MRHSILSPNVRVNSFSLVDSSILFDGVDVGRHCRIRRAIIDKEVKIPQNTTIGYNLEHDRQRGFQVSEQGVIEAALGDDAGRVLPEAIRLVLLRVRVPRYQRDMLAALAKRHGTTVDDVLTRELEDVACAHAEELAAVVPTLSAALAWPGQA